MIYFAFESTVIIDSRVEITISAQVFNDEIKTLGLNGPRGPYEVALTLSSPAWRIVQSRQIFVAGSIAQEDEEKFRMAIEQAYQLQFTEQGDAIFA